MCNTLYRLTVVPLFPIARRLYLKKKKYSVRIGIDFFTTKMILLCFVFYLSSKLGTYRSDFEQFKAFMIYKQFKS